MINLLSALLLFQGEISGCRIKPFDSYGSPCKLNECLIAQEIPEIDGSGKSGFFRSPRKPITRKMKKKKTSIKYKVSTTKERTPKIETTPYATVRYLF